jgi:hypothetical protein
MTAARCRCGHTRGQHYRDRQGRALCVYPCGCAQFRPGGSTLPRRMAEAAELLTRGRPWDREAIQAAQLVDAAARRLQSTAPTTTGGTTR